MTSRLSQDARGAQGGVTLRYYDGVLFTKVMVALAALAGTLIQMVLSSKDLARFGSQVRDAVAVEELRSEFSMVKHPRRWLSRQRDVWQMLNSPERHRDGYTQELRSTYIHVWLHVIGWALLAGAAAGAVALAFMDS